jgi:large subunit ribosomal protein L21
MKYAVIKTGGKQYKVKEGQTIEVEKLEAEKNKPVEFDEVLLSVDQDKVKIGQPKLDEKVKGKVIEQVKGKKLTVFKFKAKTGYRRKIGHRQNQTKVLIEKIGV